MLTDFEGGRALDRALDRQDRIRRGESVPIKRRSKRMSRWAAAFLVAACGWFLVSLSTQGGKIEPRHGATKVMQKN